MTFKKRIALMLGVALAGLMLISSAAAATGYSLFGDAQYVSPGNASPRAVQVRSDVANNPPYGGIDFSVAPGTTFADLNTLSSDFMPELDDHCTNGAPRFSIGIDTDGNGDANGYIFVYFGVDSASPPCVPGVWQNTTNLLDAGKLVDSSQLPGGTFYDPYAAALAKYGAFNVTEVALVIDAGYAEADGEQTFLIDNTNVDGTVYTYEQPSPQTANDCKNGGWQQLARPDGTPFNNQGDCIQYVNTGK